MRLRITSSPRACMYRPFAHLTFSLALALALPLPRRLSPAAFYTPNASLAQRARVPRELTSPVVFEGVYIFILIF